MVKVEPMECQANIGMYQQDHVRPVDVLKLTEDSEPYSLELFKKKLKISIVKCDNDELEFDLIGVNPAIANAIRRILIAEVNNYS